MATTSLDPFPQSPQLNEGIPGNWQTLTSLESLTLGFSTVTNPPIEMPTNLVLRLKSLELKQAFFNGFPSTLFTSPTLLSVILSDVSLSGGGFFDTATYTNSLLNVLHITANLTFGPFGTGSTFPTVLTGMVNLKSLKLTGCDAGGFFPTGMFLPGLIELVFADMPKLGGSIPSDFIPMLNLKTLHISNLPLLVGSFSGPWPPALTTLFLNNVSLTSSLPADVLTSMSLLTSLTVTNNPLYQGSLPSNAPGSPIRYMNFSNNPLITGNIPNYSMSSTTHLIIDKTGVTGLLPLIPDSPSSASPGQHPCRKPTGRCTHPFRWHPSVDPYWRLCT